MSILATTSLATASGKLWDAVVVGAGPGGAVAAHGLASAGASVLLLEKALFPRSKVCGGCLSAAGVMALHQAGLANALNACDGMPLNQAQIHAARRQSQIPLPEGLAVTRQTLDMALVCEAIRAGAHFLDGAQSHVGPSHADAREVRVHSGPHQSIVRARAVIVSDGLAGRSLDGLPGFIPDVRPNSRIGLGLVLHEDLAFLPNHTVLMAVAESGYAGFVRAESGTVIVGAAVDPESLHGSSPSARVCSVLQSAGIEPPVALRSSTGWKGTSLLTRQRRRIHDDRLFVLGDAAGYIEPFTGEGMTWAIRAARAVVPLALASINGEDVRSEWRRAFRQARSFGGVPCRFIAGAIRHPVFVRSVVGLAHHLPAAASSFARIILRAGATRPAHQTESVPAWTS